MVGSDRGCVVGSCRGYVVGSCRGYVVGTGWVTKNGSPPIWVYWIICLCENQRNSHKFFNNMSKMKTMSSENSLGVYWEINMPVFVICTPKMLSWFKIFNLKPRFDHLYPIPKFGHISSCKAARKVSQLIVFLLDM